MCVSLYVLLISASGLCSWNLSRKHHISIYLFPPAFFLYSDFLQETQEFHYTHTHTHTHTRSCVALQPTCFLLTCWLGIKLFKDVQSRASNHAGLPRTSRTKSAEQFVVRTGYVVCLRWFKLKAAVCRADTCSFHVVTVWFTARDDSIMENISL